MSQNTVVRCVLLPLRIVKRMGTKGIGDTLARIGFLCHAAYWEWRLRVKTAGFISWHQLGHTAESVDYEPVGYRTLQRILAAQTIHSGDVLLDYGCGKGRPIFFAARFPFRRLIGVEQSAELIAAAQSNQESFRLRHRRTQIEFIQADAKTWKVPRDVTFVFLFNPFVGQILRGAIDQLYRSWARNPRPITIIYVQPIRDTSQFDECDWLTSEESVESEGLKYTVYRSSSSERAS